MRIADEKGIALVLSLFLMTVMSVLGASLMFLSQTETYSSMNYRLMSQARYGAESGIQKTANYLVYAYTPPVNDAADPIANYNTNVVPVTCVGGAGCVSINQPVVLSGNLAAQASNYPIAAKQTAFFAAVQGTLSSANTTVAYAPYATLISMQEIGVYGGGVQTIQTWQISAIGSITAGKTAQVEVSAILETPKFPSQMYAAFGTNPGCGSLTFSGNSLTDSYDSRNLAAGISPSGGNVGTNGNLGESGSAVINGLLSSPRVGIGGCSGGNVDALTSSGNAQINGHKPPLPGDVILLPQAIVLPLPTGTAGAPTSSFDGNDKTLLDGAVVGNVSVNAHKTLTLCSPGLTCTIKVNSITLNGNADLVIAPGATVILNVSGGPSLATAIDFSGGAVSNVSLDPSRFQIKYAGTGIIKLTGGSSTSAMIYAPAAATTFTGGGDFYGSVVSGTIVDTGNAAIHYDRRLSSKFYTVGNPMMSAFNWKKY